MAGQAVLQQRDGDGDNQHLERIDRRQQRHHRRPDSYSDSNSGEQSRLRPEVHKGLRPDGEAASAVRPGGLPRRLVVAIGEITGTGLTGPC